MKSNVLKERARKYLLILLLCMAGGVTGFPVWAQGNRTARITGVVYEYDVHNKRVPLGFATVSVPDMALGTTTDDRGGYTLDGVPVGLVRMSVQYLGKLPIDTLVEVTRNLVLDFTLQNEDFKLKEVVVTATNNRTGRSTASQISRQAMDHMQATSLYDLMALLPGGTVADPNLTYSQQINIRQVAATGDAGSNLNAMGTAIIRDGAPISNNSNLSSANPTVSGGAASIANGASPAGGVDVRSISTENIESVEIIRGIPSVEYGDLTSGAVIVNTKAGREPLRVKAKANPNVYQVSMGTGRELGKNRGAVNVSADYAYNTSDPKATYHHYQRATGKVMYSNTFFNNKLRSNTSFDFTYGKDSQEENPDDESLQITYGEESLGFSLNTNGTWSINKGWLQNIRYVLSGTYTDKQSFRESVYSGGVPYSMTTTDGTVLSNFAGQNIYDAEGNELTHFGGDDARHYATFLPSSYLGHYDIDSREVNAFAKVTATLYKKSGNVSNRILLGANFKTDGNVGKGKTYDPASAPNLGSGGSLNSSFRPRNFNDIPFVHQVGLFAEENFLWNLGERELRIQAGLRYDHASEVGGIGSPRFNASFDLIPRTLTLTGGWGITAKMPTLLYLYPEKAYFEYVNVNELSNNEIPQEERLYMTTTKVYDTENPDLKIARNHKAEVGLRLNMGKVNASVTAYHERLKNGYSLDYTFDSFHSFTYNEYARREDGNLQLVRSNPVLNYHYRPTNHLNVESEGVEFDVNIGRIDAIRTSFQLNGAWMRTRSWNDGYDFNDRSGADAQMRKPVGIFQGGAVKSYREQFTTTLRATHNLPQIGFVVTLTAQAVWNNANWKVYGNDSIPVGYISLDNEVKMFDTPYTTIEQVKEAGYEHLLKTSISHSDAIKEKYGPYFCFNINVTKEISDMLRVSFFANNMFRSYPRFKSNRTTNYTVMNNRLFFGLELSLTL